MYVRNRDEHHNRWREQSPRRIDTGSVLHLATLSGRQPIGTEGDRSLPYLANARPQLGHSALDARKELVGSKNLTAMIAPSVLKIGGNCAACKLRKHKLFFCNLSPSGIRALNRIRNTAGYRTGAVLFVKGHLPRGAFVLCKGRAKLSMGTVDGRSIILGIAEAGEVLGLAAAVSGAPYEATAEALERCQVSFLKRNALLHLMRQQNEFCLRIAEYLSEKYRSACQEIRVRSVPQLAGKKLAKLLMGWAVSNGATRKPRPIRLPLTHAEIAEMIGTARETVTRLLSDFKRKGLIQERGSMLVIRNRVALDALIAAPSPECGMEGLKAHSFDDNLRVNVLNEADNVAATTSGAC